MTDTVTLPRAEYEALLALRDRLAAALDAIEAENDRRMVQMRAQHDALVERLEDAEDTAELEALEARLARDGSPGPNYLPVAAVERILAGDSRLRVWREHRGLTLRELGDKAGIPSGYLSEIETGKKPGSLDAWKAIARALGVTLDLLVRSQPAQRV